jgi:hypothetical protein
LFKGPESSFLGPFRPKDVTNLYRLKRGFQHFLII